MKKRIYRAAHVNVMNAEILRQRAEGKHLSIGVDVAKAVQFASLVLDNYECIGLVKWNQLKPADHAQMMQLLRELSDSAEAVDLVMEPSGTYGDPLRHQARALGLRIFKVGPKRCHDYAEVFDGVPSQHDGKSALLLARLHLEGFSEPWTPASAIRRELDALRKEADIYQDAFKRNLGRLEGWLARHWPELHQIIALTRVTALTLLAKYGDPRQVVSHQEDARSLLKRTGGAGLKAAKVQAILHCASTTQGVAVSPAEASFVQALTQDILRCRRALAQVRQRIVAKSRQEPALDNMSATLGVLTSAVLFVEVGDPRQFPNATAYVKAAGLNLREKSSGQYQGPLQISKRGSSRARQYLYLATLRLIYRHQRITAWYHRKVVRDGGQIKKKAVVAVMRKVAASLWYLARGEAFDASKLFQLDPA